MNQWNELITILAGFIATAFGILRLAMNQHKALVERMLGFLDEGLKRQVDSVNEFRVAVSGLSEGVRENSQLLHQMVEWLQVSTPVGRS